MRLWIVPLVVCVLLLASWPFRWERYEPVREADVLIRVRDRWTGHWWEVNPLFGTTEPIISSSLIEQRAARLERAQPAELVAAQIREEQEEREREERERKEREEWERKERERLQQEQKTPAKDSGVLWWDPETGQYTTTKPEYKPFLERYPQWARFYPDPEPPRPLSPSPAERLAAQQLSQEARYCRNCAAGVWAVLVAGSLVTTVVLYRRERASSS